MIDNRIIVTVISNLQTSNGRSLRARLFDLVEMRGGEKFGGLVVAADATETSPHLYQELGFVFPSKTKASAFTSNVNVALGLLSESEIGGSTVIQETRPQYDARNKASGRFGPTPAYPSIHL